MHKKNLWLLIIIIFMVCLPLRVMAYGVVPILDCEETLLGSTSDPDSVAWLIQEILNYIKILGPILLLVLSAVDFAQVILNGDDQSMAKAQKKLITRILLALALFLLPTIVMILLDIFGLATDSICGIG